MCYTTCCVLLSLATSFGSYKLLVCLTAFSFHVSAPYGVTIFLFTFSFYKWKAQFHQCILHFFILPSKCSPVLWSTLKHLNVLTGGDTSGTVLLQDKYILQFFSILIKSPGGDGVVVLSRPPSTVGYCQSFATRASVEQECTHRLVAVSCLSCLSLAASLLLVSCTVPTSKPLAKHQNKRVPLRLQTTCTEIVSHLLSQSAIYLLTVWVHSVCPAQLWFC